MISVTQNPNPQNFNEISFEQRAIDLAIEEKTEEEIRNRKKKSPFANFYQINKEHSKDLIWLVSENPTAYRILLFLLDHMDKYNAVMCSYFVIQEALGMSRATTFRAIKVLKERGFIAVYKSGSSNVYVVNNDLAWNSWGNNVKYCEFPANVIISAAEQEERSKIAKKRINAIEIRTKKESE